MSVSLLSLVIGSDCSFRTWLEETRGEGRANLVREFLGGVEEMVRRGGCERGAPPRCLAYSAAPTCSGVAAACASPAPTWHLLGDAGAVCAPSACDGGTRHAGRDGLRRAAAIAAAVGWLPVGLWGVLHPGGWAVGGDGNSMASNAQLKAERVVRPAARSRDSSPETESLRHARCDLSL